MANVQSKQTVVAVFNDRQRAENAIREIQRQGIPPEDIGILASRTDMSTSGPDIALGRPGRQTALDKAADVGGDAGLGAALGGMGGLLVGLASFAIPGLGAIVAAGPIAAMLGGMGIGAAAGGVIGAFAETGVSKEEANAYSEDLKRGDVVVTVRTCSDDAANVASDILDRNNAVDIQPGHNPGAEPLSADEVRRERDHYGLTVGQADDWANLSGPELRDADPALEGKTHWPHREAHDQGASLQASRRARIYSSNPRG